ncbi:polysaccharide biosynthesis protein [Longibaculum muris]|uniref:polysaccharide biosynthesis protein n=1 Tax=Longibaculum muris TaxID=1796628 RepID=UPI00294345B9|nr:polysaccharide biosynthesis protein [Longibaculum muris]
MKIYDYLWDNEGKHENEKRQFCEFKIEDLLYRESIAVNSEKTRNFYTGKSVLVTGGSIGSELCRQIAALEPKQLTIVDIYENNVYDVQQELIRKYGNKLKMRIYIASVRDVKRMEEIFREVKPEMVFHAAAHKHVPLMEASGCEAIKNNVMGTYNKANLAEKYGVEKFLLISTDKVVNPTNIMGVRLKTSC